MPAKICPPLPVGICCFTQVPIHPGQVDTYRRFILGRWITLSAIAFTYGLRVYLYILQLFLAFLSPRIDPEVDDLDDDDDPNILPTRGSDEFRSFVRSLRECKFCALDVPVFWPILLFYWLVLFISTMKKRMINYRYVPFSFGKQLYTGKKPVDSNDTDKIRT